MDIPAEIERITKERMAEVRKFPADMQLIEQEIRIGVADAMTAMQQDMTAMFDRIDERVNRRIAGGEK